MAAVAAYITTIYALERRGLVFGAAAGGAEHVSGLNYTLLPEPRPGKPRDDMCVAAVTQSTCLGGAEAPGGGGGGLHHHHTCIGAPWTCVWGGGGRRRAGECLPQYPVAAANRLESPG